MAKAKTVYTCQNCGAQWPKWMGQCNSCGEWNTLVEEIVVKNKQPVQATARSSSSPLRLDQITSGKQERIDTCNSELNRVLGGGLVPGSLILLGGEPGIGKSTLVLQVALALKDKKVLYISGEESLQQLKMRARRLQQDSTDCLFLSETSLESVLAHIENEKPDLVIIDSIQTLTADGLESAPGSVGQIRECASAIMKTAKPAHVPVILIGHITKDGNLAGPKVLEHIVDTVLQFEGDRNYLYRILRSVKNRFGSTSELGIYEMRQDGLRIVSNPSEMLMLQHNDGLSGTSIAASIEGMRSFMIEVQGLVSSAAYGTPQRSATGFDLRRLNMLLAVLEKRAGFKLMAKDVFLNIAGGLRVDDPAMDLAVIISILSSNFDIPVSKQSCFAGEVGLTGEIRPVNRIEQRITEAEKQGFSEIYISRYNKGVDFSRFKIQVNQVDRIEKMVRMVFSQRK
ncbi:DNA repair protein RadA [Prolixibacter denitrificans]|uniref:DNA repair protein RadA n=1 Tax=Prolixibacter denitrificans TaxID=1541063 RepID=A0A2P8CHT8_9BACT|nr:DNA repair protein RadA [Prolixibacter denitrificans]PSK84543.1 DNA repair protein RadA/Sms [Prolixibacter denitrificans]GET20714.1 DNA repair protein RadA [Prolixibacter denitrificans]